jgi:hypothetical protein
MGQAQPEKGPQTAFYKLENDLGRFKHEPKRAGPAFFDELYPGPPRNKPDRDRGTHKHVGPIPPGGSHSRVGPRDNQPNLGGTHHGLKVWEAHYEVGPGPLKSGPSIPYSPAEAGPITGRRHPRQMPRRIPRRMPRCMPRGSGIQYCSAGNGQAARPGSPSAKRS